MDKNVYWSKSRRPAYCDNFLMEARIQNMSNNDVVAQNCINMLNSLLSTIGLKINLMTDHLTGPVVIQDISFLESCKHQDFISDATVTCEIPLKCGDVQSMTMFARYQRLVEKFGKIRYFCSSTTPHWSSRIIRNPYFGCKSLEEALIKRDLLMSDYHNTFKEYFNV